MPDIYISLGVGEVTAVEQWFPNVGLGIGGICILSAEACLVPQCRLGVLALSKLLRWL